MWLAPPIGTLDMPALQRWNRAHPATRLSLVRHSRDWPMLDLRALPTFYFIRDGMVVEHFAGWPRDDSHMAPLRHGLAATGLQPGAIE